MDFFERQTRARKRTNLLVLLFILAVLGIIAVLHTVAVIVFDRPPLDLETLGYVTAGVLLVVGGGSLFKISMLSTGGTAVASMLGGVPVDLNTKDPKLRQLLNVVEEMAIASGVPVPAVYLLPEDKSINAFAAGHTAGDAVIGVTRGTMERLTRDELQGVIAHEYSHILNGDMRLNIRLMGVLFGILCLAIIGQTLLRAGVWSRPASRSSDKNGGAGILAIMAAGVTLLIVGYIGVFFAKLIKAAVSRQREFLADAAAVQFTRNPAGIAGALHKIGRLSSAISSPHAEEASHMFFGNGLAPSWIALLSTHPPIEQRIQAIHPNFDPSEVKMIQPTQPCPEGRHAPVRRSWLGHAGVPGADHVSAAAAMISSLPTLATNDAHELLGATALVYSLLLDESDSVREKQWASLQVDAPTIKAVQEQFQKRSELSHEQQITLLDLAIPTLRQLSPEQYQQFRKNVEAMIQADGNVHLFEFLLEKILVRHLDMHFTRKTGAKIKHRALMPLLPDVAVILGALAFLGHSEEAEREKAYASGVRELLVNPKDPSLNRPAAPGILDVSQALDRLAEATPEIKRQVLTACGQVVMYDENVASGQAQLLRAIADAIDCPVPPFVRSADSSS